MKVANAFVSGALFVMFFVEMFRGNYWYAAGHLFLCAINLLCAIKQGRVA